MRWVPTSKGLSLGVSDCSGCHTRVLPDGSHLNGAPFNVPLNGVTGELVARGARRFLAIRRRSRTGAEFTITWIRNDIHDRMRRGMTEAEAGALFGNVTVFRASQVSTAGSPYT